MPTYDDALALFHSWNASESLRKHAYAVEAGMARYAELFDEDPVLWRMTGLLHDLDYERYPSLEDHPFRGAEVLREQGYPAELIEAVLGHAPHTGVARNSRLARTLFAVDELAGFITAVAYVRPTGLDGLEPRSVRKKLKDKAFAAAVSRDDIRAGAEELGIDMDTHIANVIAGMRDASDRLGFSPRAASD
jgi:putative nucleotidyltransferase with HDIG domain